MPNIVFFAKKKVSASFDNDALTRHDIIEREQAIHSVAGNYSSPSFTLPEGEKERKGETVRKRLYNLYTPIRMWRFPSGLGTLGT